MQEMTDKTKDTFDSSGLREAEGQIRQRLLAMERDNASLRSRVRLLGIGLLVTLILGALGGFGQGIPWIQGRSRTIDVLTTQRVVLTDASGAARAEWRVDEEGDARLGLFDRQGRTRLSLAVLSGGSPGLSLINTAGQRRAGLALLPDGTTSLTFADEAGIPRVVLGRTAEDAAQLVFADATGAPRLALGLDESGSGNVILPPDVSAEPEEPGGGDG
jgi:hypothetical protein